jgi:TMEM175 potassium channel family protein
VTGETEDDEAAAQQTGERHDGYDLGRLLAFSDGVFAIAITLLVLTVPIPSVPSGPHQSDRLAGQILSLTPNILGFALSFGLVGTYWILHHQLLRRLTASGTTLLWINLGILLSICLVPFTTALLVRYGNTPVGAVAYASGIALVGFTFFVLRVHLYRHGAFDRLGPVLAGLLQPLVFVVSMPLAFWNLYAAYATWAGVGVIARVVEARVRHEPR